jgi:hypothetical protein
VLFNPTILFYTAELGNVDTFTAFALLGFVFHITMLYKNKRIRLHTIMATILGVVAVFSRQNILLFVFPFLVIFLLVNNKIEIRKHLLIVLSVIFLSLSGWVVRNYIITGNPSLSAMSGMQLFTEHIYFGSKKTPMTEDLIKWLYVDKGGEKYIQKEIKTGKTIPQAYASLDSYMSKQTVNYIINNPQPTIEHYGKAIGSIYTSTTFSWTKEDVMFYLKIFEMYLNWGILITFPFFPLMYFLNKDKNFVLLLNLWTSLFLFVYTSAFFHGVVIGNRGVLPIFPLQILLCSLLFSTVIYKIILFARQRMTNYGS